MENNCIDLLGEVILGFVYVIFFKLANYFL